MVREKEWVRSFSLGILMLKTPAWREEIETVYGTAIANTLHPDTDLHALTKQNLAYALEALLLKDAPLVHLGSWNVFTYPRIAGMVKKDMISYEKRG